MIYIIITTAIALSMDAFAVAVSCGVSKRANTTYMQLKIGIFFGLFQGIMPIIGWLLASRFAVYIQKYDHWIAFVLLSFIGIKMIKESREKSCDDVGNLTTKHIITLAIATSIDALAAGISFAILHINILITSLIIALITFVVSFLGAKFGQKLGCSFQKGAEVLGGVILIAIGTKILLEHLFIFH
ncbi:manganese efflux pump MntP family protein [Alkalibaculum sporogenes]|nr:manganese efflux pump MntP family protein [Alkalibaculum sporogenes]